MERASALCGGVLKLIKVAQQAEMYLQTSPKGQARFTFAMFQAFRIGEDFYSHLPIEDIQGMLWDGWRLPNRL